MALVPASRTNIVPASCWPPSASKRVVDAAPGVAQHTQSLQTPVRLCLSFKPLNSAEPLVHTQLWALLALRFRWTLRGLEGRVCVHTYGRVYGGGGGSERERESERARVRLCRGVTCTCKLSSKLLHLSTIQRQLASHIVQHQPATPHTSPPPVCTQAFPWTGPSLAQPQRPPSATTFTPSGAR